MSTYKLFVDDDVVTDGDAAVPIVEDETGEAWDADADEEPVVEEDLDLDDEDNDDEDEDDDEWDEEDPAEETAE